MVLPALSQTAVEEYQEQTTSYDQLLLVGITVLDQALDLVENTLTEDSQLTFTSNLIPGSTIGKHLRHARDHFSLLIDSFAHGKPPYILSYDTRVRNTPMESSRAAASAILTELIQTLRTLLEHPFDVDTELTLNAVTPFPQVLKTSLGRELWFASLHAIHHWSMVRVLAGEMDLPVQATFGVAPSTLMYRDLKTTEDAKAKI